MSLAQLEAGTARMRNATSRIYGYSPFLSKYLFAKKRSAVISDTSSNLTRSLGTRSVIDDAHELGQFIFSASVWDINHFIVTLHRRNIKPPAFCRANTALGETFDLSSRRRSSLNKPILGQLFGHISLFDKPSDQSPPVGPETHPRSTASILDSFPVLRQK